jgi:hypothetical protein
MKKIAAKIAQGFLKHQSNNVVDFSTYKNVQGQIAQDFGKLVNSKKLIEKGKDIQYAIYMEAQNVLSLLVEQISALPELDKLNKIVAKAEKEYMPGWPPMSPISNTYFSTWLIFDVKAGFDKESYFSCIRDLNSVVKLDPNLIYLWTLMDQSRLGIYKVMHAIDDKVMVEELFTKKQYLVYSPNKHPVSPGELWLTRLFPKIHESLNYQLVFTSNYVLMEDEKHWIEFLNRNVMGIRGSDDVEKNYETFMRKGLNQHYWMEFMMQGYGGV